MCVCVCVCVSVCSKEKGRRDGERGGGENREEREGLSDCIMFIMCSYTKISFKLVSLCVSNFSVHPISPVVAIVNAYKNEHEYC